MVSGDYQTDCDAEDMNSYGGQDDKVVIIEK